jgi:hypothetical protein|tara:strand:- start:501 stop:680 length:180 start_codon:yes stop_codon:yes gene_type:complete
MGKTYRRGGSERGYSSPGKSLRDKRQKGVNRSDFKDENNYRTKSKASNQSNYEDEKWAR